MVLGRLLELAVITVLVLWIITQILIPLVKGTSLFPILSKKRRMLEDDLEEVLTEQEEQQLEELIRSLRVKKTVGEDWRDDYDVETDKFKG